MSLKEASTKIIAREIFRRLCQQNYDVFSRHKETIENTVYDVIEEFKLIK